MVMKLNKIIIGFFAASCLCGCSQDEDPTMLAPNFVVNEATTITQNSAVVLGTITPVGNGTIQNCGVIYSTDFSLKEGKKVNAEGTGNISVALTNLLPNTTYYYGLFAFSGFNTAYSQEIRSFTTLALAIPVLGDIKLTQSSINELVLACPIKDDGGQTFTKVGVRYREKGSGEWKECLAKVENGNIVATIAGLAPNTEYEVYVFVEYGTEKTEEISSTHVKLATSNTSGRITDMKDGGDL